MHIETEGVMSFLIPATCMIRNCIYLSEIAPIRNANFAAECPLFVAVPQGTHLQTWQSLFQL